MSLNTLLSRCGRNTPRYVTRNGLVLSDGVTANSGGYTHTVHGPVTRVAAHTFHGGDDPPASDTAPWWESDPERVAAEEAAMAAAFPGFSRTDVGNRLGWIGDLDTGRGTFTIWVRHRPDHSLPMVSCLTPSHLGRPRGGRWKKPPHLYLSGRLCVASADDWVPDVHDATTAVAWAAHWLAAYTEWRITWRWPEEQVAADAV